MLECDILHFNIAGLYCWQWALWTITGKNCWLCCCQTVSVLWWTYNLCWCSRWTKNCFSVLVYSISIVYETLALLRNLTWNWFSVWKRLPNREVRTLTLSVIKINRHCVEFSTSLFTLALEQWTGWVRTDYWCVLFSCLCPACWFIIYCLSLLCVWAVWHVYRAKNKLAQPVTFPTYFL